MSKYTTEVRFICEHYAGLNESQGYDKVDDIIEKARSKVFDFSYPIFDENYRGVLEHKILRHYYTREIGQETVGLWKLQLENTMCEIMPYYNKLYESELLEFNPFYDIDYKREGNRENVVDEDTGGNNKGNSTRTNNLTHTHDGVTRDLYSDTPQGALTGVENETYLTNVRKVMDNSTDKNTGTVDAESENHFTGTRDATTTDEYAERVFGKRGGASYSKLLQEFRDTFLNIDMQIINELKDLFFLLW